MEGEECKLKPPCPRFRLTSLESLLSLSFYPFVRPYLSILPMVSSFFSPAVYPDTLAGTRHWLQCRDSLAFLAKPVQLEG